MNDNRHWNAAKVVLTAGLVTSVLGFTACSADKEDKVRFSKPKAIKTAETKSGPAAENQTDYIMEIYLAPEERMKRRQGRISAALEAPAAATPPATAAP